MCIRDSLTDCTTREADDRVATFSITLPSSSGRSYGPFFYQITAREDNITLAAVEGQMYTGKVNHSIIVKLTILDGYT